MSSQNVELVRRNIAAFNAGDIAAFEQTLASNAEISGMRAALERDAVQRGPEAARTFVAMTRETWSEITFEIDEVRENGPLLAALGRLRGTFRATGIHIDQPSVLVMEVEGGLITRARAYTDVDEALRMAGLAS